jgi:hypothetical protein
MRRMDAGLNKIHLGAVTGGRTSTPRKEFGHAEERVRRDNNQSAHANRSADRRPI